MNQQKELMRGEGKREKEKKKDFAAFRRRLLFPVTTSIAVTLLLCCDYLQTVKGVSLFHVRVPIKMWQELISPVKVALRQCSCRR